MATTRRDAVLNGTLKAAELHRQLGTREALQAGDRPVDVLGAMHTLGLFVMFRPLDKLLGAYLPLGDVTGVVITTQRGLHIQRFTAAHELGHYVFKHVVSTDKDVGFVARGERAGYDYQELEADAFASEFLLPKWLIAAHVNRQGWNRSALTQFQWVYQLSLRLGVSYTALCWALKGHKLITASEASELFDHDPKEAKQLFAGDMQPETWHPDVWYVSEQDRGGTVVGGPEDFLVVSLKEQAAAGYTWDLEKAAELGLAVRADRRQSAGDGEKVIGGPVLREITLQGAAEGVLQLEQRRRWERRTAAATTFELNVSLRGKETQGLPRAVRLKRA